MKKEELALQLEFDSAKSLRDKRAALASMLAIRRQIAAWAGWPSPPKLDSRVRPPELVAPPREMGSASRNWARVDLPPLKRAKRALPPALIDVEPAPPLPAHVPQPPPPPPPIHPPDVL